MQSRCCYPDNCIENFEVDLTRDDTAWVTALDNQHTTALHRHLRKCVDRFRAGSYARYMLDFTILPIDRAPLQMSTSGSALEYDQWEVIAEGKRDYIVPLQRHRGGLFRFIAGSQQELAFAVVAQDLHKSDSVYMHQDHVRQSIENFLARFDFPDDSHVSFEWRIQQQQQWWAANGKAFPFLALPRELRSLVYLECLELRINSKEPRLRAQNNSLLLASKQISSECSHLRSLYCVLEECAHTHDRRYRDWSRLRPGEGVQMSWNEVNMARKARMNKHVPRIMTIVPTLQLRVSLNDMLTKTGNGWTWDEHFLTGFLPLVDEDSWQRKQRIIIEVENDHIYDPAEPPEPRSDKISAQRQDDHKYFNIDMFDICQEAAAWTVFKLFSILVPIDIELSIAGFVTKEQRSLFDRILTKCRSALGQVVNESVPKSHRGGIMRGKNRGGVNNSAKGHDRVTAEQDWQDRDKQEEVLLACPLRVCSCPFKCSNPQKWQHARYNPWSLCEARRQHRPAQAGYTVKLPRGGRWKIPGDDPYKRLAKIEQEQRGKRQLRYARCAEWKAAVGHEPVA